VAHLAHIEGTLKLSELTVQLHKLGLKPILKVGEKFAKLIVMVLE
jgi:hypothetical protein